MRFTRLLAALVLFAAPALAATPPTFITSVETASYTVTATTNAAPAFSVVTGDAIVCAAVQADLTTDVLGAPTSSPSEVWVATPVILVNNTEVGMWYTVASATGSITVTFNKTGTNQQFGGGCIVFRNHGGVGSKPVGTNGTTGPTHNITTIGANSAVVMVIGDWAADSGTETYRTNIAAPTSFMDHPGDDATYAVHGAYHPDSGAVGTYAVGMTLPAAQTWNMRAIEILGTGGIPNYRPTGSGTFTSSTTTCTPPMPAGVGVPVEGDILLMVAESENQTIALTTANGFVEVTNSPQSAGTAGVNLATITERTDNVNTIGLGGGHCMITGTKATAGAYATSTLTMANTTFKGAMSIALEPVPVPAGGPTCTNPIALMGAGCK